MYVSSLRVDGLRGAHGFVRDDFGPDVELPPGPEGVAIADAVTLVAGSLDSGAVVAALQRLGIASPQASVDVREEQGLPIQASWPDPTGLPPLLNPDGTRQVTITIDLVLDPPLFGQLRTVAAREPRVVTALGQGASIGAKIGWLFTRDLTTAAISLLHARVGDLGFPTGGSDRPTWLPQLLREAVSRIARVDWDEPVERVAARLADAAMSPDPLRRDAFRRAAGALAEPPFGFGRLELVRVGDEIRPCFGPYLLPARQFGPAASAAMRLVDAAFLATPDVLVVEGAFGGLLAPEAVRAWLVERTRGDGATLEQVMFAPGGAG